MARIALIFPSVAVDGKITIRKSIELTRNYQRLMLAVITTPFFLLIVSGFVFGYIPYLGVVVSFIYGVITVLGIAVLSKAYKYITSEHSRNLESVAST